MNLTKNIFGERISLPKRRGSTDDSGLGCPYCPLNKTPGVNKVKGLINIKRRTAMVWAMCPGKVENEKRLALVGPAGQLLWTACGEVGLSRADFDIQNAGTRCMTLDPHGKYRNPTPKEIKCCSIYNQEALDLNGGAAQVHLVLGEIAGKALLGKRYRKDTPVFWHDEWNAYVVLADHPSFVLRCGGVHAKGIWRRFVERLQLVKTILAYPGWWGYVRSRDFKSISRLNQLDWLFNLVRREADAERPVSVDLEDAPIEGSDNRLPLMLGIGWGQYKGDVWEGGARSILLEHPQNPALNDPIYMAEAKAKVGKFLADKRIHKAMQHGSYDVPPMEEYFKCKVQGYDRDSQYVAYLYDSNRRSYSFENIIKYWFLEFADYKTTLVKEWFPDRLADAPLDRLVPYNCSDCELTLRVTEKFISEISYPLLQVYIQDAFQTDEMEKTGPILDRPNHRRVADAIPGMIDPIEDELKRIAESVGMPNFNPGTPQEVATLLYDKLKMPLPVVKGKTSRTTEADFIKILAQEQKHPAPKLILEWRALAVIRNTFISAWERSANQHDGEIRTTWYLTGTVTGRLRSGKSDDDPNDERCNLQNTHSDPIMQDLLVSDSEWRIVQEGNPSSVNQDLEVWVAADYSGIEVRGLAIASGDRLLCDQFNSGKDIHSLVGHELTGLPVETIRNDKKTRKKIKNWHFGIAYGMGPDSGIIHMKAQGVMMPREEFVRFQERYFSRYLGVKRFIDQCHADAEHGFVKNIFGFKRRLEKEDDKRGTFYLNQAVNSPIQGAAHTLVLIAMAVLRLKSNTYRNLKLVMEVHDELCFRVRLGDLIEADRLVRQLLQVDVPEYIERYFKIKLPIPILADVQAGFSRGTLVGYKDELDNPLPIPSIPEFITKWRKRQADVAAMPLENLRKVD